jgi:hypothetical protein
VRGRVRLGAWAGALVRGCACPRTREPVREPVSVWVAPPYPPIASSARTFTVVVSVQEPRCAREEKYICQGGTLLIQGTREGVYARVYVRDMRGNVSLTNIY